MNKVTYPREPLPLSFEICPKSSRLSWLLRAVLFALSTIALVCVPVSTTKAQNAIPVDLKVEKVRSSDVAAKPSKHSPVVAAEIERFEQKHRLEQVARKENETRSVSIGVVVPMKSGSVASSSIEPSSLDSAKQIEVIKRVTEARRELEKKLRLESTPNGSTVSGKYYDF